MKQLSALVVFIAALTLSMVASAETYKEGVDYTRLDDPIEVANPDKIEVREFFWFGCPHCFALEGKLIPWAAKLPEYAEFIATPAPINPAWVPHAHAFYVAQALDKTETIKPALFKALHVDKKRVVTKEELATFFQQYGVDESQFSKLYESFSVRVAVRKAAALAKSYQLSGVPAIIVNGKYVVKTRTDKPVEHLTKVASFLIEKEKAANASNKS